MKEKQFNRKLEKILRFIYQIEDKAKKELDRKPYKHNMPISQDKSLYTNYNI